MKRKENMFSQKIHLVALAFFLMPGLLFADTGEIQSIEHNEVFDGTAVRIRTNQEPTFSVFKLTRPPRVVVDVSNAALSKNAESFFAAQTWAVSAIESKNMSTRKGKAVRVSVTLARPGKYKVRSVGNDILITVIADEKNSNANATVAHKLRQAEEKLRQAAGKMQKANVQQEKAIQERTHWQKQATNDRKALRQALKSEEAARQRTMEAERAARKAEEELSLVKQEIASIRQAKGKTDKGVAAALKRAEKAQTKMLAARAKVDSLEGKLAQLQNKAHAAEKRASSAEAYAKKLEGELEAVIVREQRARAEANTHEKTARTLERKLRTSKEQTRSKDLEKLQAKLVEENRARSDAETKLQAYENRVASLKKQLHTVRKTPANIELKHRVRGVKYEEGKQVARVKIELSGPLSVSPQKTADGRLVLDIPDAAIDSKLERTLDVTKYNGPLKAVSTFRKPSQPNVVRIVVEPRNKNARANLNRLGNNLYWDFALPKKMARKNATPNNFGATSTLITQQTVSQLSQKRKVYTGRRVDYSFKDADVHDLLSLIAETGGFNLVIPEEINEKVTIRLRRIPWDQAFETILASKGLWYKKEGNRLYRIAKRSELDKEEEERVKRANAAREAEPTRAEIFTLNYSDASKVKTHLEALKSPKGRIEVDARTNSIIINDIASSRREIINLARTLDTQTPQVQIEARIVEARSTYIREVGIQWGGAAQATAASGNATGLRFPSDVTLAGGADDSTANVNGLRAAPTDFIVNMPAAVGAGSGGALGLTLGSIAGNFNLSLRLSALEDQGTVRIVSAPKVKVLNNVKAKISQGVKIPISQVSANGVSTTFVNADLSLDVTPHVSQRDCSVEMQLKISKNEADFVNTGAGGDPTILTKETDTRVLVQDGETTVIGGIYTRNTGRSYSKVPFLGDIPLFGWLFKTKRSNDERTEMLIFITPRITNRAYLRCE